MKHPSRPDRRARHPLLTPQRAPGRRPRLAGASHRRATPRSRTTSPSPRGSPRTGASWTSRPRSSRASRRRASPPASARSSASRSARSSRSPRINERATASAATGCSSPRSTPTPSSSSRTPVSSSLPEAERGFIRLSSLYARSLEISLEDAVGEQAEQLRERRVEVLTEAVAKTMSQINAIRAIGLDDMSEAAEGRDGRADARPRAHAARPRAHPGGRLVQLRAGHPDPGRESSSPSARARRPRCGPTT